VTRPNKRLDRLGSASRPRPVNRGVRSTAPFAQSRIGGLWFATLGLIILGCRPDVPPRFDIMVRTGRGDGLDTFAGTITKDLIANPDTTVAANLTSGELETIRGKAVETRFFQLPDTLVETGGGGEWALQIKARMGRKIRTVTLREVRPEDIPPGASYREWDGGPEAVDQERRFRALERAVIDIVRAKDEYKALPEPRGGYM
jgi:hypothetical protein